MFIICKPKSSKTNWGLPTSYQALGESAPPPDFALRPGQGFEMRHAGDCCSCMKKWGPWEGGWYTLPTKLEAVSTEMLSELRTLQQFPKIWEKNKMDPSWNSAPACEAWWQVIYPLHPCVFSNTAVLPLPPSQPHQPANATVYAKHIMEAETIGSSIPAAETCWQNGDKGTHFQAQNFIIIPRGSHWQSSVQI